MPVWNRTRKGTEMKKAKVILIIVILLMALIVSLQNTEEVETKFLLMRFTRSISWT